jgi:hypothetical protein
VSQPDEQIPEDVFYAIYRLVGQPTHPRKAWFRQCVKAAFTLGYAAGRAAERAEWTADDAQSVEDFVATGPNKSDIPCPKCGSPRWVSISLDGGSTRRAQCVPCGSIHARLP